MQIPKEKQLIVLERGSDESKNHRNWYGGYILKEDRYEQVFNTECHSLFFSMKNYTDIGYIPVLIGKEKETEFMKGSPTLEQALNAIKEEIK